jgi:predicted small lipoprotein YifL
MIRNILVIALVLGLVAPIAACGRKSSPQPPPDTEYPRQYPTR